MLATSSFSTIGEFIALTAVHPQRLAVWNFQPDGFIRIFMAIDDNDADRFQRQAEVCRKESGEG